MPKDFGGKYIEEVGGHLESMMPKRGGDGGVDKKSAHYVVNGFNFSFRFAILRRCMGARKPKIYTIGGAKRLKLPICKFPPIVTLNVFNVSFELSPY